MKEYSVSGTVHVGVGIIVKANSEEEAKEIATEKFGGISSFCGNGGHDKLIGVHGNKEWISSDYDTVKWDDVEELD